VKDNLATADKMQTTAGSLALVGSIVPSDSVVVNRVARSPAPSFSAKQIFLSGQIFAATRRSMVGARGAVSHAIHHLLSFDPCGSSSGSAVAAAANLCAATVGTETGWLHCLSFRK